MMADHVPTPWRVCDSHPQRACIYIKPEDGWVEIATLYGGCFDDHDVKDENGVWQNDPTRMATAAFIVKAVNSHDALVEALATIADIAEGSGTLNSFPNIAKIARGALETVKGRA